jgi:hypothetical protein
MFHRGRTLIGNDKRSSSWKGIFVNFYKKNALSERERTSEILKERLRILGDYLE